LLYESALKTQKMNLKPVMACEDTSISYRSKLYLKLVKHGLWTLVWLTLILVHFIRPFLSIGGEEYYCRRYLFCHKECCLEVDSITSWQMCLILFCSFLHTVIAFAFVDVRIKEKGKERNIREFISMEKRCDKTHSMK
jgi:hypothetical protein